MTIATAAIPSPIPRPNGVFPFVDMQTGALSEHGLLLLQRWYDFMVGMNRLIPCNASGTNVITLTPLDASPLLEQYNDFDVFTFVAANTSSGSVTATVVPKKGALATVKVYKTNGAAQAGSGDVVANSVYLAIYADHLDSGAGGLVIK